MTFRLLHNAVEFEWPSRGDKFIQAAVNSDREGCFLGAMLWSCCTFAVQ